MPIQPKPLPSRVRISPASGLYSTPTQELRLDVEDGRQPFPQMVASGNFTQSPGIKIHWVATLKTSKKYPLNYWTGEIRYPDPDDKKQDVSDFPYTKVVIWLSGQPGRHQAYIRFVGDTHHDVITLPYQSTYFRRVKLVFAAAKYENAVTTINTGAFDNSQRPSDLPSENLSIPTVFERAGFDVKATDIKEPVKLVYAREDKDPDTWSDNELHHAMQDYWKKFPSIEPWAIWVLFTSQYNNGAQGVMFDIIGPKYRQGCAIFNDFNPKIKAKPSLLLHDHDPISQREIFFSACHEIGHCFNLGHSEDKMGINPWFEKSKEPKALSFMQHDSGTGGDFFKTFRYRFSGHDQSPKGRDLTFLRHAPEHLVNPSDIPGWYQDRGFGMAEDSTKSELRLKLRVNREQPIFEFMEPVTLELKLTNTSKSKRQTVDKNRLSWSGSMTVIITKDGPKTGQLLWPYARHCRLPSPIELEPGKSIYGSLFVSAGANRKNGWFIDEPGNYLIRVVLHSNGQDIPSIPLSVRVAPPSGGDKILQERLAQDFFSDDVGRIIAFHGSRFSENGTATLHEVAERLSSRRVAVHASWALGHMVAREDKRLAEDQEAPQERLHIEIQPADREGARKLLAVALTTQNGVAIESFGHVDYKLSVDFFSNWLYQEGERDAAVKIQDDLYKIMSARQVKHRPILGSVLRDIKDLREFYKTKKDLREFNEWKKEWQKKASPIEKRKLGVRS